MVIECEFMPNSNKKSNSRSGLPNHYFDHKVICEDDGRSLYTCSNELQFCKGGHT